METAEAATWLEEVGLWWQAFEACYHFSGPLLSFSVCWPLWGVSPHTSGRLIPKKQPSRVWISVTEISVSQKSWLPFIIRCLLRYCIRTTNSYLTHCTLKVKAMSSLPFPSMGLLEEEPQAPLWRASLGNESIIETTGRKNAGTHWSSLLTLFTLRACSWQALRKAMAFCLPYLLPAAGNTVTNEWKFKI